MNKKIILVIGLFFFTFFLMPKANAKITRVQLFNYSNNTFTNTHDTNYTCFSLQNVQASNMRITFDDSLISNGTNTLSLTLTLTTRFDYPWFRWGTNPMSGILVGSAYVSSQPTSGTTIRTEELGASVATRQYLKQSNIVFNFSTSTIPSTWSVNIPFDQGTMFNSVCINDYQLQKTSSTNDSQAIINNNNINTQNIINSQNNTTNAINDINDTLQDTTIDNQAIGNELANITTITDTPITDLLTLPVTLLQRLYNSLSNSCSSYSIPFGFGLTDYTLNLPCINLGHEKYLGRVVWGTIDDLICLIMVFAIFKMIIWFYSSWTTLKDNFMYLIDPSNGGLF